MKPSQEDRRDVEQVRLTFGEHLEELRVRLVYGLLALMVCFVCCYAFKVQLLSIIMRPHRLTMAKLGLPLELRIIRYQEGFLTLLRISFFAALVLASPIIVYQIWRFVSVGLYRHERRWCYVFGPITLVSFLLGVLFGYLFLIPLGLQFLLSVLGPELSPQITMSSYVALVALLTVVLGLLFELPLVMLFLAKIGIVTSESYAQHRKPAILIAFIAGAVLTPPDPFTQMMMAIPIVGLYEIGILVSGPTRANLVRFTKLALVAVVLLLGLPAWSRFRGGAELIANRGQVTVGSYGSQVARSAESGPTRVPGGSVVSTGDDGRAELRLADGTRAKLNAATAVQLAGRGQLRIFAGQVFVRPPTGKTRLLLRTPVGDVSTTGATFDVRASAVQTTVTVVEGSCDIAYRGIRKTIVAGRQDGITTGGITVDVNAATGWQGD